MVSDALRWRRERCAQERRLEARTCETLKPKSPPNSWKRRLSIVPFPTPEGPQMTRGRRSLSLREECACEKCRAANSYTSCGRFGFGVYVSVFSWCGG